MDSPKPEGRDGYGAVEILRQKRRQLQDAKAQLASHRQRSHNAAILLRAEKERTIAIRELAAATYYCADTFAEASARAQLHEPAVQALASNYPIKESVTWQLEADALHAAQQRSVDAAARLARSSCADQGPVREATCAAEVQLRRVASQVAEEGDDVADLERRVEQAKTEYRLALFPGRMWSRP